MKTSPKYPLCHEDRKAQKLLDRIDKKLREKATAQAPKRPPRNNVLVRPNQEPSSKTNVRQTFGRKVGG